MIWCVDDDAAIRDIEVYTLKSTGYEARGFSCGEELFTALQSETPKLIILDIMLPGEDGIAILKKLWSDKNTKNIPVVMATAKGTEMDVISGLDMGADDYLKKPFGMMEMVSRVKAVLRRCGEKTEENVLRQGVITLKTDERQAYIDNEKISLTYKEFELLKLFMENPGIVFTRDKLLTKVWGMDYFGETRTVDMHINTLRKKLGSASGMIVTVINAGYRLEV